MKNTEQHPTNVTRRRFVKSAAGAAATIQFVPSSVLGQKDGKPSANDEFRVGCVGVGGMQGGSDVRSISSAGAEVVALCDVDSKNLAAQKKNFPNAKFYSLPGDARQRTRESRWHHHHHP